MTGMETWKRTLGNPLQKVLITHSDGSREEYPQNIPGSQTTYSYRSSNIAANNTIAPSNWNQYLSYLQESDVATPYDTGHPFDTVTNRCVISHRNAYIPGDNGVSWKGPLYFSIPPGYGDWISAPSWNANHDGTLLINKAIPTHPQTSFVTGVLELVQPGGLPRAYTEHALDIMKSVRQMRNDSLIKRGATVAEITDAAKKAGGVYLNVAFGYAPMVKDTVNLALSVLNSQQKVAQYIRDSGKDIHRKRSLAPSSSFTQTGTIGYSYIGHLNPFGYEMNYLLTPYPYGYGDAEGKVTMTETTTSVSSFSGSFTYMVPEGEDFLSTMERYGTLAEKLVGLRPTAEVLWNVAPWSWLVDWNSNLGSIISNATRLSEDGLVMRYGYVMRKTVTNRIFTLSGVKFKYFNPGPITMAFQMVRKERRRGNPFGFANSTDDYTSRQWAILAALGLTGAGGNTVRGY